MKTNRSSQRRLLAAGLAVGLVLAGCTQAPETLAKRKGPAKVTAIDGSKVKKVTLTEKAVERIGLEMAPIADEAGTRVMPYTALVYDEKGGTFAFTSPEALSFLRSPLTVAKIAGGKVFLTDGPAVGTQVVTIGSAELYGTEQGLGY